MAEVEAGWEVISSCPNCKDVAKRTTYDIGSGPELSCASCEWCWGANGQDLKPLPVGRNRTGVLTQWVIYRNPRDYLPPVEGADFYVAREWVIGLDEVTPSEVTPYGPDPYLENCRRFIQAIAPGSFCLTRSPEDDPTIVETWT